MSSTASLTDGVTVLITHEEKERAKVASLRKQLENERMEQEKKYDAEKREKESAARKKATEELHEFSTETLASILRAEENHRDATLQKMNAESAKKETLVTQFVSLITNGSLFR